MRNKTESYGVFITSCINGDTPPRFSMMHRARAAMNNWPVTAPGAALVPRQQAAHHQFPDPEGEAVNAQSRQAIRRQ
jgi:hypothetical protein